MKFYLHVTYIVLVLSTTTSQAVWLNNDGIPTTTPTKMTWKTNHWSQWLAKPITVEDCVYGYHNEGGVCEYEYKDSTGQIVNQCKRFFEKENKEARLVKEECDARKTS